MAARVPTGKPRGRPKGCVKSGGRVAGKSLDKTERIKITSEMAGSILSVFERLGGDDFLYRWAKENQTAFVNSCLSRLMPPMPRGDDDAGAAPPNPLININNIGSDFEAARRIAFALAKAAHEQETIPPVLDAVRVTRVHAEPEPFDPKAWVPPTDAPDMPDPGLLPDPAEALDTERQRWASELPMTPEQRRDNQLIRETVEGDISTYRGGPGEQPGTEVPRPATSRKMSPAERCRALSRRGRDLL